LRLYGEDPDRRRDILYQCELRGFDPVVRDRSAACGKGVAGFRRSAFFAPRSED
jgi:hypothetical protein